MNIKIKLFALLLGLLNLFVMASCGSDEPEPPTQISLKLNLANLSLYVGQSETLEATVSPSDISDSQVVWTTSDPGVATVNQGVVAAVGEGSATITATCGNASATCLVTVAKKTMKYQYFFGYAYSKDLLMFLTPKITIALDGQEPITYKLEDGNNTPADAKISYKSFSVSVTPSWSTVWWIGESYETEQKGTMTISYERKEVDYDTLDLPELTSSLQLLGKPFIDKSTVDISICTHMWVSISIGSQKKLQEIIDEIVSSPSNIVTF